MYFTRGYKKLGNRYFIHPSSFIYPCKILIHPVKKHCCGLLFKSFCIWFSVLNRFWGFTATLQRYFEFHKGLKVIRCCLGSHGNSDEAHPQVGANLTQPFVIKLKLHSCLHSFQECLSWQRKSRIYDWNKTSVINHILAFIPISGIWQLRHSQYRLQKLSHSKYIQLKFQKSR